MGRKAELEFILECISEINRLRLINPNLAASAARALKEVITKWTKIDIIKAQTNNLNNSLQQTDKPKEELLIYDLMNKVFEPYTLFIDNDRPVNKVKPVDNIDFLELSKNPLWKDIAVSTSSNYIDALNKIKSIKENIVCDDIESINKGIDELKEFYQKFITNMNNYYLDQQVNLMYLISQIQYLIEKKSFNEKKDYSKMSKGIWASLYEDITSLLATNKYPDLAYEISNKYGVDVKVILRIVTSILKIKFVDIAPIDFNLTLSTDEPSQLSYLDKIKIHYLQRKYGSKEKPKITYDNIRVANRDSITSVFVTYVDSNGRFLNIYQNYNIRSQYLVDCKNGKREFILGEDVEDDHEQLEEKSIGINDLGIKFHYLVNKQGKNRFSYMPTNDRCLDFYIFNGITMRGNLVLPCQNIVAYYDNYGKLFIGQYNNENSYKNKKPDAIYQFFVCNGKLFLKYLIGNGAIVVKIESTEEGYSSETSAYHDGNLLGKNNNGITKKIIDNIDNIFSFPDFKKQVVSRIFDDKDILFQLMNGIIPIEFTNRLEEKNNGSEREYVDKDTGDTCSIYGDFYSPRICLKYKDMVFYFTVNELGDDSLEWEKWLNRPLPEGYEDAIMLVNILQ